MKFDPKEFDEFKNTDGTRPGKEVTEAIFSKINGELHPSPWKVFSKLALIHLAVGMVTLSICPQFGLRVFGEGMGLMTQFMSLGEYGCPIACGSFFLGSTILVATALLKSEEIKVLRKNQILELSALSLLSLGAFIMINPREVVSGFAIAWVLGSLLGGWISFEAVSRFRFQNATLN